MLASSQPWSYHDSYGLLEDANANGRGVENTSIVVKSKVIMALFELYFTIKFNSQVLYNKNIRFLTAFTYNIKIIIVQ
jgi:hypothetical protein